MATNVQSDRTRRIRELNDTFRQTFIGGGVLVTAGVRELPPETNSALLDRVRAFDQFTEDNDPHQEHDFGSIEIGGERFF
jgi:hypothetical protein